MSSAVSATTVLPEPTSPCSSRCIGAGARHVARDLVDRALLVVGQRERQRGVERRHERPVDVVRDAALVPLERALARDEPDLHAQELVELQPLRARPRARSIVSGRWMPRYAHGRGRRADASVRQIAASSGSAKPRGSRALAARSPTSLPQLPRVHLGLARLRVHGHEHAGRRRSPGSAEHVDDRVRHLAPPAVVLDLAEERGLGPDGELALAPGLVEEHEPQVRRAVEHLGLDDRPVAVACAAP